jgi:flagellar export protein FliJ
VRPFRFRLGRVLRVRALEEEIARGELLEARSRALEAETRLERARADLASARADLAREQSAGRLEPAGLLARDAALPGLLARLRLGLGRAREERARAEEVSQRWRLARGELQGLERLEQRARERHRRQLELDELRELDEVALRRGPSSAPTEPPH